MIQLIYGWPYGQKTSKSIKKHKRGMKKKILMFVATIFALTVVLVGCATDQVTTATAVRDETKDESFAFIIHNTGKRGVRFQSIIYNDATFKGLTSNYVLFEKADGTVKAVSIKEKKDCQIGEYQFDVLNFEDLPEEQKGRIMQNIK